MRVGTLEQTELKKREAEQAILIEWDRWASERGPPTRADLPAPKRATSADALIFYGHLQQERPDLLHFRALGDKWPHVHEFPSHAGVVN